MYRSPLSEDVKVTNFFFFTLLIKNNTKIKVQITFFFFLVINSNYLIIQNTDVVYQKPTLHSSKKKIIESSLEFGPRKLFIFTYAPPSQGKAYAMLTCVEHITVFAKITIFTSLNE